MELNLGIEKSNTNQYCRIFKRYQRFQELIELKSAWTFWPGYAGSCFLPVMGFYFQLHLSSALYFEGCHGFEEQGVTPHRSSRKPWGYSTADGYSQNPFCSLGTEIPQDISSLGRVCWNTSYFSAPSFTLVNGRSACARCSGCFFQGDLSSVQVQGGFDLIKYWVLFFRRCITNEFWKSRLTTALWFRSFKVWAKHWEWWW